MINLLKLSLILLALSSCCEKYKNKIVISAVEAEIKQKGHTPLRLYYGDFNFILDSSKQVYFFYRKTIPPFCSVDIRNLSKLKFIDLSPEEIKVVGFDTLDQFLNGLKLDTSNGRVKFVISSPSDTVYSKGFDVLLDYIQKQNKSLWYWIRRRTEEESVVLKHIKLNKVYDPHAIQWKTQFKTLPIRVLPKKRS